MKTSIKKLLFFNHRFESKLTISTPAQISNLRGWWNSQNVVGTTTVSQMTDLSGNNNHLIQAVVASQPLIQSNQMNGLQTLKFDGTDDFLEGPDLNSDSYSIFVVYHNRTLTNGTFYSTKQSGGQIQRFDRVWVHGGSPSIAIPSLNSGNFFYLASDRITGIHTLYNNVYDNNNLTASGTTTHALLAGNFLLGARGSTSTILTEYLNANIAEVILYNRVLLQNERNAVHQLLRTKYNI